MSRKLLRREGASHIKTADFVGDIDIPAAPNLLLYFATFFFALLDDSSFVGSGAGEGHSHFSVPMSLVMLLEFPSGGIEAQFFLYSWTLQGWKMTSFWQGSCWRWQPVPSSRTCWRRLPATFSLTLRFLMWWCRRRFLLWWWRRRWVKCWTTSRLWISIFLIHCKSTPFMPCWRRHLSLVEFSFEGLGSLPCGCDLQQYLWLWIGLESGQLECVWDLNLEHDWVSLLVFFFRHFCVHVCFSQRRFSRFWYRFRFEKF